MIEYFEVDSCGGVSRLRTSEVFDEFSLEELYEKTGEIGTRFISDRDGYQIQELTTFEWIRCTALNLGGDAVISLSGELSDQAQAINKRIKREQKDPKSMSAAVVIYGITKQELLNGLLHFNPIGNRIQY